MERQLGGGTRVGVEDVAGIVALRAGVNGGGEGGVRFEWVDFADDEVC